MGLFDISKPHVSGKEFGKMIESLHSKGFDQHQVDKVKTMFHGDMYEAKSEAGIDRVEADRAFQWMHENKHVHGFSDHQMATLQEEVTRRMKS